MLDYNVRIHFSNNLSFDQDVAFYNFEVQGGVVIAWLRLGIIYIRHWIHLIWLKKLEKKI
jgi:hypothetical protein